MFDREVDFRLSLGLIGNTPPTLAYWAVYMTDERGQWTLVADGTPDPFGHPGEGGETALALIHGFVKTL